MKKIFASLALCAVFLLGSVMAVSASEPIVISNCDQPQVLFFLPGEKPAQTVQREWLYGGWMWDANPAWEMYFYSDGTLLDGYIGSQVERHWRVTNGRLFVDGQEWEIHISPCHSSFSIYRSDFGFNTYFRDSFHFSPDFDTEVTIVAMLIMLAMVVVAGLICLTPFVIIIILIALLAGKRSKKDQIPLWTTTGYHPNNFPPNAPSNPPRPQSSNYPQQHVGYNPSNVPPPPPNFPPSRPQPKSPTAPPNPPQPEVTKDE